MRLKTLSRITLAAALFSAIPFASVTAIETPTPSPQAQRLANLKTRGSAEIDRRIKNLNAAMAKLSAATRLTPADKTALTGQINNELAALTTLKAKLGADADLATARTDVASIVTDYRVYVLMLPKARMVAVSDRFAIVEEKLTALHDKLKTKVDAQNSSPASGISADQVKLQDMQAKITSAKAKTDGLAGKLLAVQPADYNANHAVLVEYHTSLKAAEADIKAARDDAKSVIESLNKPQDD